ATQHISQPILLIIGLLLGYTLFHARFGFTSAFRRLASVGNGQAMRAHMLMLAVAVTLFAPILRSEEHTSELQSRENIVCRLLLAPRPPPSPLFPYTTLFRSGYSPYLTTYLVDHRPFAWLYLVPCTLWLHFCIPSLGIGRQRTSHAGPYADAGCGSYFVCPNFEIGRAHV